MKIVCIFTGQLYAFHYSGEKDNELTRLLSLWRDTQFLKDFINQNHTDIPKHENIEKLPLKLIDLADEIDDTLLDIYENNLNLENFFKPLDNNEYQIVTLSKQKGRKNYLRLYALKIDTNCFVITGGAIKFHHLMKDRKHTFDELTKIEKCREFLKSNDVFDAESFYE